ncbi:MAG: hypothetical protein WCL46_09815, partial [Chlorobium sp.]
IGLRILELPVLILATVRLLGRCPGRINFPSGLHLVHALRHAERVRIDGDSCSVALDGRLCCGDGVACLEPVPKGGGVRRPPHFFFCVWNAIFMV